MRWLFALLVAAVAMLSGASGRRFLGKERDYDVVHGSVAVNVTVRAPRPYDFNQMRVPDAQVPAGAPLADRRRR